MDRLVTGLAGQVLVTARVAHQAGLARVVERRVRVEVAALLGVRCRMAVRTVRFTRRQPVITAVGGRIERYRGGDTAVAFGVQRGLGNCNTVRRGAEVEDAYARVTGTGDRAARIAVEVKTGIAHRSAAPEREAWTATGGPALTSMVATLASGLATTSGFQMEWVKSPSPLVSVGSSQAMTLAS